MFYAKVHTSQLKLFIETVRLIIRCNTCMKKRYILYHFVSNEVYFALILKEPELKNLNEIPVPQTQYPAISLGTRLMAW